MNEHNATIILAALLLGLFMLVATLLGQYGADVRLCASMHQTWNSNGWSQGYCK